MIKKLKALYAVLIGLVIIITISAGCQGEGLSNYDKIHEKLISMTAYSCDAEVKYYTAKAENTYKIKMTAINDGRYAMTAVAPESIKGTKIAYDGKLLWQYNPQLQKKINISSEKIQRSELNLFSFINNMVKSQDVGVESGAAEDKSVCTVFEAKIPSDNSYFSSEKLWVDNETMLPVRLEIYNSYDEKTMSAEFENFEYNPEVNDSVFDAEK